MDHLIHFHNRFHAAGHGTFFSGQIKVGRQDTFSWVYDCGSRRPSHLNGLIDGLCEEISPRSQIDLACISHFDEDHVCGMELLLKKVRVGMLVLPYMPLAIRLRVSCQVRGGVLAHQVAALALDPGRLLSELGLGGRVDRIVLVDGGDSDGQEPLPLFLGEGAGLEESGPWEDSSEFHPRAVSVVKMSHHQPVVISGLYELSFYNTELLARTVPTSGASVDQVASEVEDVFDRYRLCARDIPKDGWVGELRQIYKRHFGSSAKQKNDISLCALGRPTGVGGYGTCSAFGTLQNTAGVRLPVNGRDDVGVLMTGDIRLDRREIRLMKRHFGDERWNSLRVMQIPHHGSKKNWEAGLFGECSHQYSVICAPGSSAHHPHSDVLRDLPAGDTHLASYGQSVCFDFHRPK